MRKSALPPLLDDELELLDELEDELLLDEDDEELDEVEDEDDEELDDPAPPTTCICMP